MPLLRITTNKALTDAMQSEANRFFSTTVASLLGKPENYVMIILHVESAMMFAGSDDPLAYLELKSLGLPEEKTADFSSALCAAVSDQFAIPAARIYIEFSSPARHLWGWNGTTF